MDVVEHACQTDSSFFKMWEQSQIVVHHTDLQDMNQTEASNETTQLESSVLLPAEIEHYISQTICVFTTIER